MTHQHALAPAIMALIASCMFLPASAERCGQGRAGEGGHWLPSTLCSVARRGERVTGELKKCQKCTGTQQRPTVLCWSRHPHTSTSTCRTLALVTWASLFSSSPPQCSVTARASNEGSRRFNNHVEGPYYGLLMVESKHYAKQATG